MHLLHMVSKYRPINLSYQTFQSSLKNPIGLQKSQLIMFEFGREGGRTTSLLTSSLKPSGNLAAWGGDASGYREAESGPRQVKLAAKSPKIRESKCTSASTGQSDTDELTNYLTQC